MNLNERLKHYRTEINKKQSEFADFAGVPRSTYAAWEQGRYEPRASDLIKLKRAFNCTYDELIEGKE